MEKGTPDKRNAFWTLFKRIDIIRQLKIDLRYPNQEPLS